MSNRKSDILKTLSSEARSAKRSQFHEGNFGESFSLDFVNDYYGIMGISLSTKEQKCFAECGSEEDRLQTVALTFIVGAINSDWRPWSLYHGEEKEPFSYLAGEFKNKMHRKVIKYKKQ